MKRVQGFIHQCFQKVNFVDRHNTDLEKLYNKRTLLRSKTDDNSKAELEAVNIEHSEKFAKVMFDKIMVEVSGIEESEDGGLNPGKLWKFKKKLSPKAREPPTAMLNTEGQIITSEEDIKSEAIKHYTNVFEERQIKGNLKDLKDGHEKLCLQRLKKAAQNKTPAWTVEDVKLVLKCLKVGKSKAHTISQMNYFDQMLLERI